ncbi:DPP IV N-terminal domain-containing protein [Nonomuraea typhae]|uniref:DPP IV N-terminal domain-containing protein n=1 Tax=Nonomuraea typhae TaxID=2603600 RepID=A0ABW7YX22_9ACTN
MTDTRMLTAEVYRDAERLHWSHRQELMPGAQVRPLWTDGGGTFLYARRTTEGNEFVRVDPAAGTREAVSAPDFAGGGDFTAAPSPDGRFAVYREGHDLWLRDLESGRARPLTTDGEPDYEYGTGPDSMEPRTLMRALGLPGMPPAVAWSPDSRRILAHRTDQRRVRQVHWVEARPADGSEPALHAKRYPYPGDGEPPLAELVVLDAESGEVVRGKGAPLVMPFFSPIQWRWVWWSADGTAVFYLEQSADHRTLRLNRMDPDSGEVTTILSETGATRVEPNQFMGAPPIVEIIGDEVLWYSQRDGWGHLYLYDVVSGTLKKQVTSGAWAVREILHVDEAERVVYFVASGLAGEDPYRRSVCRAGLDGSGFAKVIDDDLDHAVTVSENAGYFVDSASTVASAPVTTVRGWDGSVLVELERPDTTALEALGWRAPQQFRVKAADGRTDIHGVIHLPRDFDPAKRYPVIDSPYPGPQVNRLMPGFDQGFFGNMSEQLAALGFVVVALDGRGTPGRDKPFHDVSYGRLATAGSIDDHVAALRHLAETRPWMDLDRGVAAFGMSGGGFATVRAMLDHPDFYTVGVSICGSHDHRHYHQGVAEMYDGPPAETDYAKGANAEDAHLLEGKLLLIHGGMDDNVSPTHTLRLADRLLAADKDFELRIVPAADHLFIGHEHHLLRWLWDFMVRHHMGAEPPAGYRIAPTPLDMDLISGFFS